MQCASALAALLLATPISAFCFCTIRSAPGDVRTPLEERRRDRDQDFRNASGQRMHRVASSAGGLPISIAMACKLCVLHALR
jgi:hypothetical protein